MKQSSKNPTIRLKQLKTRAHKVISELLVVIDRCQPIATEDEGKVRRGKDWLKVYQKVTMKG